MGSARNVSKVHLKLLLINKLNFQRDILYKMEKNKFFVNLTWKKAFALVCANDSSTLLLTGEINCYRRYNIELSLRLSSFPNPITGAYSD